MRVTLRNYHHGPVLQMCFSGLKMRHGKRLCTSIDIFQEKFPVKGKYLLKVSSSTKVMKVLLLFVELTYRACPRNGAHEIF